MRSGNIENPQQSSGKTITSRSLLTEVRIILRNVVIVRKIASRVMRVVNWIAHIRSASEFPLVAVPVIALSALIWGFPLWAGLLLVRPLIQVDFRPIPNRLGHLVIETDLYIARREERGRRKLTVWFFSGTPSNSFYADRLPRYITIWPPLFAWPPFLVQEALSGPQANEWPEDITPLSAPNSWFDDGLSEHQMAELFENLGADPTRPYICLWVRDSSYGEMVSPCSDSWLQSHRDSRLSNYSLLASRFESEGYSVIRMGVSEIVAGEEFGGSLIDYASSPYRSDSNDFLITKFCSFAIVGDSGSIALPLVYRKPMALVDLGGPYGLFGGQHIKFVTLKTIVWENSGEPLTLSQMLHHRVDRYTERSEFADLGVLHVDNTPNDLEGVAVDVLAFLGLEPRRDLPKYHIMEKDFLKRAHHLPYVFDPRFFPSQRWLVNNPHFAK